MTWTGFNPGNLRYDGTKWQGLSDPPQDHRGFCLFDTMEHGVRALAKTLLTYYDEHHLQCIEDIIGRWAPPSENNTAAYIADVCARMRRYPEEIIDLHDPEVMGALVDAIGHHETGQWLDPTTLTQGVTMAYGVPATPQEPA